MNKLRSIIFVLLILLQQGCTVEDVNIDMPMADPDTSAPLIVSMSPGDDATAVDKDAIIELIFNEPIDQNSIGTESLKLLQSANEITGVLTYNSELLKLSFTPSQELDFLTEYTVLISNMISDTAQNSIENFSWSFTTVAESTTASYRVTFMASWSQNTHPIDFPSNAHFSGLIGMTHIADTSLFKANSLSSPGIKSMAETGSKTTLTTEIEQMIAVGGGQNIISGGGIGLSPSNVSIEFDIAPSHSVVSIVSMIAPSPDWFIALEGLNLYKDGAWIADTTIMVKSYDAGTDSGPTFTSANVVTSPSVPIFEIIDSPLAPNAMIVPLGTMNISRIDN